METHCPHCKTRYNVDDEVLAVCGGEVRCFRCERVFNVLEVEAGYRIDRGKGGAPKVAATETPRAEVDRLVIELQHAPDAPVDETKVDAPPNKPAVVELEKRLPAGDLDQVTDTPTPFDLPDPGAAPASHWLSSLLRATVLIALTLGAFAQWGWLERERLLAHPRIRPLLTQLGERLGIPLPVHVDAKKFTILGRDLSPDLRHKGALRLRAVARNDSAILQPLPAVQLTLFDIGQNIVARRTFVPAQYLPDPAAEQPIAPQRLFALELTLEDPGERASGFELSFH